LGEIVVPMAEQGWVVHMRGDGRDARFPLRRVSGSARFQSSWVARRTRGGRSSEWHDAPAQKLSRACFAESRRERGMTSLTPWRSRREALD
jgi:hypothetical protein